MRQAFGEELCDVMCVHRLCASGEQAFGEELSGDVMCVPRLVRAVRQVFGEELQTRSNSQCSTPLMPSDSPARFSPAQVSCFSVKGN